MEQGLVGEYDGSTHLPNPRNHGFPLVPWSLFLFSGFILSIHYFGFSGFFNSTKKWMIPLKYHIIPTFGSTPPPYPYQIHLPEVNQCQEPSKFPKTGYATMKVMVFIRIWLTRWMDGWMDGWLAFSPHLFMWQLVIRLWGPYLGGKVCCERTKEATSFPRDGPARVKLFLIASIIHAWLSPLAIAFKPHAGAGRMDTILKKRATFMTLLSVSLHQWDPNPNQRFKDTDMGLDTGILFLCQMGHTVKNWHIK